MLDDFYYVLDCTAVTLVGAAFTYTMYLVYEKLGIIPVTVLLTGFFARI